MSNDEKPTLDVFVINGVSYDDIVSQNYQMDPETEDVIYGDDLENGMIVLSEDGRASSDLDMAYNRRLHITNRWCEVTEVRAEADGVYFIALYADGQKKVRSSTETSGWLVKKSSIPEPPKPPKISDILKRGFEGDLTIETHDEPARTAHGVFEV